MPHVMSKDGAKIYFEQAGSGIAVVFLHEYAGDYRMWEPQIRPLSRQYRCVTFSARGYPKSDIPTDPKAYSQKIACDDVIALMDHLAIEQAHIVGLSMGGYTALNLGLDHPQRCRSLTVAGCGWGSTPGAREEFAKSAREIADSFLNDGMELAADKYASYPVRLQHKGKDPRGWLQFRQWLSEHSPQGQALTILNVQLRRPTLYELKDRLAQMTLPVLIVTGDEDEWCLDGSVLLKRTIPTAALLVLPRSGHTITSEEPEAFNRALLELFGAVDGGRWMTHRPR